MVLQGIVSSSLDLSPHQNLVATLELQKSNKQGVTVSLHPAFSSAAFGVERVSAQDAFYHLMAKAEKTAVVPPVMERCDSNAVPVQYAMVMLFQMCCVIHCAISSLMHYVGFYSTLEETQINFQNDLVSVSSYSPPPSPSHPPPPPFLHPHPNEGGGDEGVVWYHLVLLNSCNVLKNAENRLKID